MRKALQSKAHSALIKTLIEAREASGFTQSQLAEKLGEYQSFVARLESGQRRVDVIEFLELAEVMDFDPLKTIANLKKML